MISPAIGYSSRGLVAILAVLAAILGAPPAGSCEEARAQYEDLSFEDALQTAERVLERDPDRPLACLEVKALVLIVLNRLDEGRAVLKELFTRAPDIALEDPSLSPVQRENIESLRESMRPMSAQARARWISYDSLRLDVLLFGGLRDASRVRYEVVPLPQGAVAAGELALGGRAATATVGIPADAEVDRIQLTGRVLNRTDLLLHQFTANLALSDRPLRPDPVVIESSSTVPWLVWAGIGTAAIGAAIVIAILAQPRLPDTTGTLGRIPIDR